MAGELFVRSASPLRPLNRWEPELAYLHYPAGGYYNPHFDVPAALQVDGRGRVVADERRLSFLWYLNSGWEAEGGGALRV